MLTQLTTAQKVVGAKQARRALNDGRAKQVFLAWDADPMLTEPLALLCQEKGVDVVRIDTMSELGLACGITVGAAIAAIV